MDGLSSWHLIIVLPSSLVVPARLRRTRSIGWEAPTPDKPTRPIEVQQEKQNQ